MFLLRVFGDVVSVAVLVFCPVVIVGLLAAIVLFLDAFLFIILKNEQTNKANVLL